MTPPQRPFLLLALGNDIMGDDGVGLAAARALSKDLPEQVDCVETPGADLALLEVLSGYERALLLDSIVTGRHQPGTILQFTRSEFDQVLAPSPHCAGLPEVLKLAERMGIDFPEEIRVLAMEIAPPQDFRETLGPAIERVLPAYVAEAGRILHRWEEQRARDIAHSEPAGECAHRD